MRPTPTQEEMDAFHRGERKASHEPDGSPEQHIGAQGQIENAHMVKYRKRVVEPAPQIEPPKVEEKAAEAEPARATYKTRAARAVKDEEEKKPE